MSHDHGARECRELFARLSEYVDGELPEDLCAGIEGHLDDCPPCRCFLESLRRTVRLVERMPRPRMSEALRAELLEAWRRGR